MNARRIRTPDQRLRVFVSSTLGELAAERAAVRDAVRQLRLTPVMFELGARPHPPQALYRSYLEQSDVFVGIYWQSYGWVAPDMGVSGLEDEYVRSAGMPRLVYVKRPAPEAQPRLAELLGRIRGEDSTSYKPFRDAEELRDLVLDDLAVLLTERFAATGGGAPPPPAVPVDLPVPPSSFIGREELRDRLAGLLRSDDVRLVTLTGAGGAGKTRLALEAAAGLVPAFADGVLFVDLSAESEPDGVLAAVLRRLALPAAHGDPPLEVLQRGLRDARMLLLLDNFEQVVAAAGAVGELLARCPRLAVLVTSREALRVRGEVLVPVPPLSLPGPGAATPAGTEASEAVRLFVERAAAVVPGFALTDANRADVVAVCALLDGLPLAIELAAARVRLFGVGELRARLERRLDELGCGPRDLPERQRTLRRAIEWSTELLDDDERAVLAALSAFEGARLADVEAVAAGVPAFGGLDVVDRVGSLVDKNLVVSTVTDDGRNRLTMLRTVHEFAAEQLERRPDVAAAVRAAHAEHYTGLARAWRGRSASGDRDGVLAVVGDELGNLRAAWSHWVRAGAVARLGDLLETLWGHYDARGDYREAARLGGDLLDLLSRQPETPERIREEIALETSLARSMIAVHGWTAEVERGIRAAVERSDAVGASARFPVLRSLATLRILRADLPGGAAVGRELLALAEQRRDPAQLAEARLVLGVTAMGSDVQAGLRHLDASLEHFGAARPPPERLHVGPDPRVVALLVSGLVLWRTGAPDRSRERIDRGLALADELGHPWTSAYASFHGALAALWRQDRSGVVGHAEVLLRTADAHDYPVWRALALVLRGTARIGAGEPEQGLGEVDRGFDLYAGLSTPPVFWSELLVIRATGCLAAGRLDRVGPLVEEAAGALWPGDPQEPELDLLRGELLLAVPEPDVPAAEAAFERAAASAAALGLPVSHLEAATRLARLRHGTPRAGEARAALRAVHDAFPEAADVPQLLAARALLG